MYWTDRIDIQIDHYVINTKYHNGSHVFSKACESNVGQANLSDKLVTLWSHQLSRLKTDNPSMQTVNILLTVLHGVPQMQT